MVDKKNIDSDAIDAMIGKPCTFKVNGEWVTFYHATLGKMKLLQRLYLQLGIDERVLKINPYAEYLRVTKIRKDIVLRILVYYTLSGKDKHFDESGIREKISFFRKHLSDDDIVELLVLAVTMDDYGSYAKAFGIDKSIEKRDAVLSVKSDKSHFLTLGGESEYGSLLYRGCELFRDYDYVVWGISYVNLMLLLNDAPSTVHLSDEEMKLLPRSFFPAAKSDTIDAGSAEAWAQLRKLKRIMKG